MLDVALDSGYQLKSGTLQYNGAAIDGNSFAMPDGDVTVTAEFEPVSATSDPGNIPDPAGNSATRPIRHRISLSIITRISA